MRKVLFPVQSEQQNEVDSFIRKLRWCPWAVRAATRGQICYIDADDGTDELLRGEESRRRFTHFLDRSDEAWSCVIHSACDPAQENEDSARDRACRMIQSIMTFTFEKGKVPNRRRRIRYRMHRLFKKQGNYDVQLFYRVENTHPEDPRIACNALAPHYGTSHPRYALWLLLSFVWRKHIPPLRPGQERYSGSESALQQAMLQRATKAHGGDYETANFWIPHRPVPAATPPSP